EGGFGRVYKGKHVIDGALYAVKKIRVNGVEDKQLREVQTLSVVNHEHVVRYYQ
ncbi:putative serine/threonine-kinase GCN2-like protein, partial [Trifolium medium]|nr:putative serine/threonine-kinase GCN2-like protein [Trifolium medium]